MKSIIFGSEFVKIKKYNGYKDIKKRYKEELITKFILFLEKYKTII